MLTAYLQMLYYLLQLADFFSLLELLPPPCPLSSPNLEIFSPSKFLPVEIFGIPETSVTPAGMPVWTVLSIYRGQQSDERNESPDWRGEHYSYIVGNRGMILLHYWHQRNVFCYIVGDVKVYFCYIAGYWNQLSIRVGNYIPTSFIDIRYNFFHFIDIIYRYKI